MGTGTSTGAGSADFSGSRGRVISRVCSRLPAGQGSPCKVTWPWPSVQRCTVTVSAAAAGLAGLAAITAGVVALPGAGVAARPGPATAKNAKLERSQAFMAGIVRPRVRLRQQDAVKIFRPFSCRRDPAPMLNIASNLVRNARLHPDKVAVVGHGGQALSYAQLDAATNRLANGLRRLGLAPGDKVALSCPNGAWFPIAYYAILKAGAVVVPLNILLKAPEIAYHLQDSEARVFLCFQGNAELPMGAEGFEAFQSTPGCEHFYLLTADPAGPSTVEGAEPIATLLRGQAETGDTAGSAAEDTAVILYTSGTTGLPKGAELSHSNISMNMMCCVALTKLDSSDVHLVALPLFHTFGQTVQMNAAIAVGASMVLMARFDPNAVLEAMAEHSVSVFCGVPTMFIGLLHATEGGERHDLKAIAARLRLGVSGGAPMPVTVLRQFEQHFGVVILEGYGLSETSPVATFNHFDSQRVPGSIGQPAYGIEVAIMDESGVDVGVDKDGEIAVRGHNVMKGYYRRPEATAQAIRDGWFHTGDIGRRDIHGNYYIVDRLKDMLIRGGFNVYPRELEEVLMTHPGVGMVAVIGVPHEVHGEEVKAFIMPKPGVKLDPDEIIAWSRERMAAYKYPRIVEIVASLPMTATGKILKRALRVGA
jgi:long-chain acyl-CoA synthetase